MLKNLSIYIHYPFCKSKCPYCDFNSHIAKKIDYEEYIISYEKELDFFVKNISPCKVNSIFFGGGTPSLMPSNMLQRILDKIKSLWLVDKSCEISMEVNPTSFETKKIENFRKIGVNRLSLGIQALNDKDLQFLGRNHNSREAIESIKITSQIYDNFSFDLIYTRPKQKINDWLKELQDALNFQSPHLSLYQLTIEKGTPFFKDFKEQKFTLPNDDESAAFYHKTNQLMLEHGYDNYEISNYAKPNSECLHNLSYWQGDDYIGIGAGAHSRVYFKNKEERQSLIMKYQPQAWLKEVKENGVGLQKQTNLNKKELLQELILTSLRTKKGLTNNILQKHNFDSIKSIFDKEKINYLLINNIINYDNNSISINEEYRILTNQVIKRICQIL